MLRKELPPVFLMGTELRWMRAVVPSVRLRESSRSLRLVLRKR